VREVRDALLVPNAALRFVPPEEEDANQQSGGLLRALIPMPRFSQRKKTTEDGRSTRRKQRVWVLRNDSAEEVEVMTGATDGTFTEITGGDLSAGSALIVDAARASS